MSKHTPGPWSWDDTVWNYDPEQQAPWLVGPNDVRILSGQITCPSQDNARLIAAAPDLLEELQEILEWAIKEKAPLRDQEIASIRAAIAKATGATA